ncbi:MAG: hypothetical protein U5N58_05865 [Actinomycetota bacterium]|nr:hypothetical protein [Actinomycetota bacterium]
MKIGIIILPIFLSVFIFYASILSRRLKVNNIFKRFSTLSKKFNQSNKSQYYEDLQLFIENQSSISFFKVKIRSVEKILILRIFLSSLFFILLNLFGFLFSSNLLILSLLGSAVIFFIPLVIIKNILEKTKETVLEELPDTIEIISSLLKAGLTIDEAILYISKNYPGKI